MQYTAILSLLLTASVPLISAAAAPKPGFHNPGALCPGHNGQIGCSLDGTETVLCTLPLLAPILGQKQPDWQDNDSCTHHNEGGFCNCSSTGTNCQCFAKDGTPENGSS